MIYPVVHIVFFEQGINVLNQNVLLHFLSRVYRAYESSSVRMADELTEEMPVIFQGGFNS